MIYTRTNYDAAPSADADPREIEAWALIKSARSMEDACTNTDNPDLLRNALRKNQLLWTIFQDSVASEDSLLPIELRKSVLQLSIFVDTRTFLCLGDLDIENVKILVDLNRNVALGLQAKVDEDITATAVNNNVPVQAAPAASAMASMATKIDC